MRIDSHQHFWRYSPAEYGWMDDRMTRIRRDFLPEDLAPLLAACGLDGAVAVQARSSLEETRFLLELARAHDCVKGVVGWADLCALDLDAVLDELCQEPLLRGLRHVVQDEPDDDFLRRADFQAGVRKLAARGLVYDILIYPRQLDAAVAFAAALPDQPFVLDHLAKPPVASGALEPWERDVRELAQHPHVHCKVSGLVTEARWHAWEPDDFRSYLDVVFDAFGEERLMFGSDWPVCLAAAGSYRAVAQLVLDHAAPLSPRARAGLFGENAARFYGLDPAA